MFWRETPRETVCHLRALAAGRQFLHELALFTAWHVEAFARVERLPELAPLLELVRDGDREEQDAETQLEVARAIAASFGAHVPLTAARDAAAQES